MTLRALKRHFPSLFAVIAALTLLATACSSSPPTQQAGEVLFSAEQPSPTIVEPADPIDETTTGEADADEEAISDTSSQPPESLAFADWTVNDLVDRLSTATNSPITVRFTGNGEETLELDGDQWRVVGPSRTPSSEAGPTFATRGSGDEEWVTYGHVASGIRASQAFAAATLGASLDQLLAEPGADSDPIFQKFILDQAIVAETTDLTDTWVPYERNDESFFTATLLTPTLITDILTDVAVAVADADVADELVTTSSESSLEADVPNTDYTSVVVDGEQSITITSVGGWTIIVTNGIDDPSLLGAPGQPNVLTRELLLTATSVPAGCITPIVEAGSMVDNGLVSCNDVEEIANVIADLPDTDADDLGPVE